MRIGSRILRSCFAFLCFSVQGADLNAGKALALRGNAQGATACQDCHRLDGSGNAAAGFPSLAGGNAAYLAKQLADFQNGTRNDSVMQSVAKKLSPTEVTNAAAYFAAQKPGMPVDSGDKALIARGATLALSGQWDKDIPACVSCHGPSGRGVGDHFPALAGQHAKYIAQQLDAWRRGTRSNDPQALMKGIAMRLSEEDSAAVAAYFASLAPRK